MQQRYWSLRKGLGIDDYPKTKVGVKVALRKSTLDEAALRKEIKVLKKAKGWKGNLLRVLRWNDANETLYDVLAAKRELKKRLKRLS